MSEQGELESVDPGNVSVTYPAANASAGRPPSALKKKPITEKAKGPKEEPSAPKTPSKQKEPRRGKIDDLDFAEPENNSGDFVEPTEPDKSNIAGGSSTRKPGRIPSSTKKNQQQGSSQQSLASNKATKRTAQKQAADSGAAENQGDEINEGAE